MEVSAGEAEGASAVLALGCPGDVLRNALGDGFSDVLVAAVCAVGSAHRALGSDGCQDRGDPFHLLAKPHVEVPLVVDREGLDAARDGMIGKLLEVGVPVGIDGPVRLEVAAEPVDEAIADVPFGHLDRVMDADEPDALFHQLVFELQVGDRHVPAAAVAIDDDRVRTVEGSRVFWPIVLVNVHVVLGHRHSQTVGEQQTAGVMLVVPRGVARLARQKDDLLLGRLSRVGRDERCQNGKRRQQDVAQGFLHGGLLWVDRCEAGSPAGRAIVFAVAQDKRRKKDRVCWQSILLQEDASRNSRSSRCDEPAAGLECLLGVECQRSEWAEQSRREALRLPVEESPGSKGHGGG